MCVIISIQMTTIIKHGIIHLTCEVQKVFGYKVCVIWQNLLQAVSDLCLYYVNRSVFGLVFQSAHRALNLAITMNSFNVFYNVVISNGPIATVLTGIWKLSSVRHQVSLKFSFGVGLKIAV